MSGGAGEDRAAPAILEHGAADRLDAAGVMLPPENPAGDGAPRDPGTGGQQHGIERHRRRAPGVRRGQHERTFQKLYRGYSHDPSDAARTSRFPLHEVDTPKFVCKVATFPPQGKMRTTRCDLHIHSAASVGNDEWYTRLLGRVASHAEPASQYELCKARGMSLVTLTDHDTIAGGLTLIDRPDFFLSEEVTTVFPENGCVIHVLAWNITPDQHAQIQARRNNVYELCDYLNRAAIAHGLAPPLPSSDAGLHATTLEKLLLLFPTFERMNGLIDPRIEPELTTMLDRLTPELIAALARKHRMASNGAAPHRKALTAGSDDHGHRRAGTIYTEVDGAELSPAAFLRGCMAGLGRSVGRPARFATTATCVKRPTRHGGARLGHRFLDLMGVLARRASPRDDHDVGIADETAPAAGNGIERAVCQLASAARSFDVRGVRAGVRDLFDGLRTALPVLVAANQFGKQESQVRTLRAQWTAFSLPARERRLALFSDSLEQVDGVSTWCRRFVARARAAGHTVLLPDC